jgi:drug/metabolite transporter (DMT)-like permease
MPLIMDNASATPAALAQGRSGAGTERPLVAIGFVLIALALFSIMDALSKVLAVDYDSLEIAWGRYVVMMALLAPLLLRDRRALMTRRLDLQLLRGVCMLGSAAFFIAGLGRLAIADATAIGFAAPLMVTALSIPLLGEHVGPRRWSAVAVGFLGVLIVIRPGSGAIGTSALLPLASAVCWALGLVVTRHMRNHDKALTTLFYSTISGVALSTLALPFIWVQPDARAWAFMTLMAVLSVGGQYLIIAGLARGDVSLVAPFTYSQMIWSTLVGLFVFHTAPTAWTWCGAAVIVGSGIYIAHRERMNSLRKA